MKLSMWYDLLLINWPIISWSVNLIGLCNSVSVLCCCCCFFEGGCVCFFVFFFVFIKLKKPTHKLLCETKFQNCCSVQHGINIFTTVYIRFLFLNIPMADIGKMKISSATFQSIFFSSKVHTQSLEQFNTNICIIQIFKKLSIIS